jgi:RimJ/RimL family protein N-acetyltransferase
MFGPTLITERLILRPPEAADFQGFADFMMDEESAKFVGGLTPPPATWRGLRAMIGCWAADGFGMFSVIERDSGHWIGRLGPWAPFGWPGTEVGWGIARPWLGKGYATEGASAAIDWAIDHLGWADVIHIIDPANTPSEKVAARLGSRLRGPTQMPAPFDTAVVNAWGQTAAEWKARRR